VPSLGIYNGNEPCVPAVLVVPDWADTPCSGDDLNITCLSCQASPGPICLRVVSVHNNVLNSRVIAAI
jgi:hypothetical protein